MTVDIYVREVNGSREIRFPILPEKISITGGDATFVSYEIMDRGPVDVPSGTELSGVSWDSEFPGEGRKSDSMLRGTWKDPKTYHNILNDWKENGTKVNVLVTGTPINKDMYVSSYNGDITGAFCDIAYKLEFKEARSITITTTKVEVEETPQRPAETKESYTIKSGDTLWGIAEKFYGSGLKWKTLYDANKEIIESTAKKRWKAAGYNNRDSENGHWIWAGTVITIP